MCCARPLEHGADHDRRADGGRRALLITTGRVGVAERVDVGGVLRPDHQVGLRLGAGGDRRGGGPGHGDVVVEDGAALGVEVQPGSRDVALDGHEPCRCAVRRGRHEQRGEQQGRRRGQDGHGPAQPGDRAATVGAG